MNTCVHAACTHTSTPLRLNAVHLPGLLKKKKKKNLHSLLSVSHFPEALFFGWWKRAIGFGRLAECGFSIQTNNRAESVSANGDQACQDEGFGDGGRLRDSPSLSLSSPYSISLFFFFFFNRELTSRVKQEDDASSALSVQPAFPYQGHVWRLLHCVDLKTHTPLLFFLCFALLCLF